VRNLAVTAHSTRLLFVTWERPAIDGSNNAQLTYNIMINGTLVESTNDSTTSIIIRGLQPNTSYCIEVIKCASNNLCICVKMKILTLIIHNVKVNTSMAALHLLFHYRYLLTIVKLLEKLLRSMELHGLYHQYLKLLRQGTHHW